MKKLILITIVFFTASGVFARKDLTDTSANKPDTTAHADTTAKTGKSVKAASDSIPPASGNNSKCQCQPQPISTNGWWLVFAPVILFIALFILILIWLRNFKFNDALAENEMPKYTIVNPQYANIADIIASVIAPAANSNTTNNNISSLSDIVPPTLDVTNLPQEFVGIPGSPPSQNIATPENNYRPSISRYIAFFSGMLTVIIAICMTSFFIYHYMATGCAPDLSALSTVLIALGIGVTPYAVNKISSAVANRKTDD